MYLVQLLRSRNPGQSVAGDKVAKPKIDNEDGTSVYAVLVNGNFNVDLTDDVCLQFGVGVGYASLKTFDIKNNSIVYQGKAEIEFMTSDNMAITLGARYLRALNDKYKDVNFSSNVDVSQMLNYCCCCCSFCTSGADDLYQAFKGKAGIPTDLKQQFSSTAVTAGIKFVL